MIELKDVIYKNKKNGRYYVVLGTMVNATNAQDGQIMVRYRPGEGETDVEYCREIDEFYLKFEPREKT